MRATKRREKKVDHSTGSLQDSALPQLACIVTDAGQTLSTGSPPPVCLRVNSATSDGPWGSPSGQGRVTLLSVSAASWGRSRLLRRVIILQWCASIGPVKRTTWGEFQMISGVRVRVVLRNAVGEGTRARNFDPRINLRHFWTARMTGRFGVRSTVYY